MQGKPQTFSCLKMGMYQVQLYFLSSPMSRKKEKEKIKFDIVHCYGFYIDLEEIPLGFCFKRSCVTFRNMKQIKSPYAAFIKTINLGDTNRPSKTITPAEVI